ncbi:MAG TPA: hypothetical protein VG389_05375 [Myxococcota bacterium]|jgi:hypothetical protein|nr:hypothetical protein [Myxococcota bacterium]
MLVRAILLSLLLLSLAGCPRAVGKRTDLASTSARPETSEPEGSALTARPEPPGPSPR